MRKNYDLQRSHRPCLTVRMYILHFKYILTGWEVGIRGFLSLIRNQPIPLIRQKPVIIFLLFVRVGQVVESQGEIFVIIIQYNAIRKRDDPIEDDLIINLFSGPDRMVIHFQTGYQHPSVGRIGIYILRIEISQALIISEEQSLVTEYGRAVTTCYVVIVKEMLPTTIPRYAGVASQPDMPFTVFRYAADEVTAQSVIRGITGTDPVLLWRQDGKAVRITYI